MPQSGGLCGGTLCKLYPPTTPLRRPGRPVFLGSQPCVPAAWLAERLLLAGDIESNPGPKPTLKTLTHTRTQPPTITKYTNSSIQPPQTRPPPLSLVHPPPKTPTSVQPPKTPTYTSSPPALTLTPYTLDRIQPTRPDSPHISPPHKPPYVPTPAHSHTRNKQKTSKTKHKEITILQLNANGIRSTVEELKHLLLTTQPDVVAVQESKLNPASRTPKIPNYTAIRTDRKHKQGGRLITYITTISSSLYNRTTWKTIHALNSDHLPILLTIQTDNKITIQQNRRSYTNYRKADWDKFTQDTEDAFSALQPPTDIHDANKTFTNILYQAGKKHIPVGKIRNTDKLLPQDIRNKIRQRNWTSKKHATTPKYT